uniref:Uncharacterized protein n=1 Tax=viral metagenome TaxID=1070528 RepID=A0A6H2A4L7_9ZZZZ
MKINKTLLFATAVITGHVGHIEQLSDEMLTGEPGDPELSEGLRQAIGGKVDEERMGLVIGSMVVVRSFYLWFQDMNEMDHEIALSALALMYQHLGGEVEWSKLKDRIIYFDRKW